MDKDILMDKLRDFGALIVCIMVVLVIARFTGFLNGFTPADFQDAFGRFLSAVPQLSDKVAINNSSKQTSTRYKDYLPSYIPEAVTRSANYTGNYKNLFNLNNKFIYYVYDNTESSHYYTMDFHHKLNNYFNKNNLNSYYTLAPYTLYIFKNMSVGNSGPSEICNTLAECKAQRDHAADFAALQVFFTKCAKTLCVVNPPKNQYIVLKKRDLQEAMKALEDLRSW